MSIASAVFFACCIAAMTALSMDLHGQEVEGHWRFLEIEEEMRDDIAGRPGVRNFTTGGPGSVTYNTETDWGDRKLVFRATGRWTDPPGVLLPGEEIEVSLGINVSGYSPPDFHWNPGGHIGIWDSRPSRDPAGRAFRGNYGSLMVSALGERAQSDRAVFAPPRGREDHFYTIGVNVGGAGAYRRCHYVYEWVPGAPAAEDIESDEVSDALPPPDTSWVEGSWPVISHIRGEVRIRIQGEWYEADQGMRLPSGATLQTGANGVAHIVFSNRPAIRMRPDTELYLPEGYDQDDSTASLIRMITGRMWARFRAGTPFSVTTSNAIAGVRDGGRSGTDWPSNPQLPRRQSPTPGEIAPEEDIEFGVEVDPSGGEVFVCYLGEIEVTPVADEGVQDSVEPIIPGGGEKVSLCPVNGWSQTRLDAVEESVGAILGRPDYPGVVPQPRDRTGRLSFNSESGDWRLEMYEQDSGARHGILNFDGIAVREAARDRLTSPFGLLLFHGPFDEENDSGWLAVDAETLPDEPAADKPSTSADDPGYSIIMPPPGNNEVRIERNGELAWSLTSWMVFPEHDMIDQTGNGMPNLLVRYARGRSFRGFVFLELGPEGVREIWGLEVHASQAYGIEEEIQLRRERGESLEEAPGKTGDQPPEIDTEPSRPERHGNEHVTLDSASHRVGEPIEIQWHKLPGNDRDWINVVPADASDSTWGTWWYAEGASSGKRSVDLEEPGEYEIRVYFDWPGGGYNVQSRLRFTVR